MNDFNNKAKILFVKIQILSNNQIWPIFRITKLWSIFDFFHFTLIFGITVEISIFVIFSLAVKIALLSWLVVLIYHSIVLAKGSIDINEPYKHYYAQFSFLGVVIIPLYRSTIYSQKSAIFLRQS